MVRQIVSAIQSLDRKLIGVRDGRTSVVDWRDVLYLESVDKRCFIYTADQVLETPLTLREVEERFDGTGLFRCSKSQIVNLLHLTSLRPEFGSRLELVMKNSERLIVSRKYAKPLKERLGVI